MPQLVSVVDVCFVFAALDAALAIAILADCLSLGRTLLLLGVLRLRQVASALRAALGHALFAHAVSVVFGPLGDGELVAFTAAQRAFAAVPSVGALGIPSSERVFVGPGEGTFSDRSYCPAVTTLARFRF